MARLVRKLSVLAVAAVAVLGTAGLAQAQFYPNYPAYPSYPGPLVIPSPWQNQTTVIYPSAFNPGAGMAIPGTQQNVNGYIPGAGFVNGTQWIGMDGRPHGVQNVTDPFTGHTTTNFYSKRR